MTPDPDLAVRTTRKTLDLPDARAAVDFDALYAQSDFERIKRGLIPQAMEDKWFIFFEEPWLYFHRSWTGACIYAVRFEPTVTGAAAVEAWASRNKKQYKQTSSDYDRALLSFLVEALLLGRDVKFPVSNDGPVDLPRGVYQHHLVGQAYPETTIYEAGKRQSWWKRILR